MMIATTKQTKQAAKMYIKSLLRTVNLIITGAPLLAGVVLGLAVPHAALAQPVKNARGCTTIYFIDKDCDGKGVGVRSSGSYGSTVGLVGDSPDADDNDPSVSSVSDWRTKYGSGPTDTSWTTFAKFLLASRGYTVTQSLTWFVDGTGVTHDGVNGNDSTCVAGDITHPCYTPWPALLALGTGNGDGNGAMIVYRGGTYLPLNWANSGTTWGPKYPFPAIDSSSSSAPFISLGYPGEAVVQRPFDQGTVTVTNGSAAVVGASGDPFSTLFTFSGAQPTMYINGSPYNVLSVTDSTHLTLTTTFTGTSGTYPWTISTSTSCYEMDYPNNPPVTFRRNIIVDGFTCQNSGFVGNAVGGQDIQGLTITNMEATAYSDTVQLNNHITDLTIEQSLFHENGSHVLYTGYSAPDVLPHPVASGLDLDQTNFFTVQDPADYACFTSNSHYPAVGVNNPDWGTPCSAGVYQSAGADSNIVVTASLFYGNGSSNSDVLHLNSLINGFAVTGNIFTNNSSPGAIGLQTGTYNGLIENNIFLNQTDGSSIVVSTYNGDVQSATHADTKIINNTIWSGNNTGNPGGGIYMTNYTDNNGTVTVTNGSASVAWFNGAFGDNDRFCICWNSGDTININSVAYTISSVTNYYALTLTTPYSGTSGQQTYEKPTDLTAHTMKRFTIENNLIATDTPSADNCAANTALTFLNSSYPATHTVTNNILWRTDTGWITGSDCAMMQYDNATPGSLPTGGTRISTGGSPPFVTTYTIAQFQSYYSSTNTVGDPLLVNASIANNSTPGVFDFHLQSGSPAINAGTNTNAPQTDIQQNYRIANADTGAIEGTTAELTWTDFNPGNGPPAGAGWNDWLFDTKANKLSIYTTANAVTQTSIYATNFEYVDLSGSSPSWTDLEGTNSPTDTTACALHDGSLPKPRHPYKQEAVDTLRGLLWIGGGFCSGSIIDDFGYKVLSSTPTAGSWTWVVPDTTPSSNLPSEQVQSTFVYDAANDVLLAVGERGQSNWWSIDVYCTTVPIGGGSPSGTLTAAQTASGVCSSADTWIPLWYCGGSTCGTTNPAMDTGNSVDFAPAAYYIPSLKKIWMFGAENASGTRSNKTFLLDTTKLISSPNTAFSILCQQGCTPPPVAGTFGGNLDFVATSYDANRNIVWYKYYDGASTTNTYYYNVTTDNWVSVGNGAPSVYTTKLGYDKVNDKLATFTVFSPNADIWATTLGSGGAVCSISPSSLGPWTVGQAPGSTLTESSCGTSTFSLTGSWPTGVSGCSSGAGPTCTLSGTISASGTFTPTVAFDTASNPYSIVVNAAPTVPYCTGTSLTCPSGTQGTAYSNSVVTSGGTGSLTCAVVSGSLPAGLSFSGCTITGTPSGSGTSTFTVDATDANSITGSTSSTMTLTIAPLSTSVKVPVCGGGGMCGGMVGHQNN